MPNTPPSKIAPPEVSDSDIRLLLTFQGIDVPEHDLPEIILLARHFLAQAGLIDGPLTYDLGPNDAPDGEAQ